MNWSEATCCHFVDPVVPVLRCRPLTDGLAAHFPAAPAPAAAPAPVMPAGAGLR